MNAPPTRTANDEEERDQDERHDRVEHGLLHDDVELVQPVAEDRDRAGTRQADREDGEEHEEDEIVERGRLVLLEPPAGHERRDEQHGPERYRRDEPAHLLALLADGPSEPQDQRGDRGQAECEQGEAGDRKRDVEEALERGDARRVRGERTGEVGVDRSRADDEADEEEHLQGHDRDRDRPPPRGGQLPVREEQEDPGDRERDEREHPVREPRGEGRRRIRRSREGSRTAGTRR